MAKILIVESDVHMRVGISDILELEGYEPIRAENGVQGLEMAQTERPDLIITANTMPHMNGLDMIDRLREISETAAIPIIFMSAAPLADHPRKPQSDIYMLRPIDAQDLLDNIAILLNRRD